MGGFLAHSRARLFLLLASPGAVFSVPNKKCFFHVFFFFFAVYLSSLDEGVDAFIRSSKAASTWAKYGAALKRFDAWADSLGLCSSPAEVRTVLRYLAHVAHRSGSISAVSAASCAISSRHKLSGFPNPCSDPRVGALCEGVKRKHFKPAKQSSPLTPPLIQKLFKFLVGKPPGKGSIRDWRTAWLALMTFKCCARFDDVARLKVCDVSFVGGDLSVFFPSRKNDQVGQGHTVVIKPSGSFTCVVSLSRLYFKRLRRAGIRSDGYALPRLDLLRNGDFKPYPGQSASYASCRLAFRLALRSCGVSPSGFGLHSGKVGGIIALRESGMSWRSLCSFAGWAPGSSMPERYAKEACKKLVSSGAYTLV